MNSRDLYPLLKVDKAHADWCVALSAFGFFATSESAKSARKDRDNYAEWHRIHRINELQSYQPLTPLQQSLAEGFVGFNKR